MPARIVAVALSSAHHVLSESTLWRRQVIVWPVRLEKPREQREAFVSRVIRVNFPALRRRPLVAHVPKDMLQALVGPLYARNVSQQRMLQAVETQHVSHVHWVQFNPVMVPVLVEAALQANMPAPMI